MKLDLKIEEIVSAINGSVLSNCEVSKVDIVEIDSRNVLNPAKSCFFCFEGNKTDGHDYIKELIISGCKTFIVSKDIKIEGVNIILVKDVLIALQDLAKFHRGRFDIPVIGITGSNGKTIVKEWLYELLKDNFHVIRSPKSYNSQLGVALSVLQMRKEHTLGIFEAGISKSGEMLALKEMIAPNFGVFTGIGDAHNNGFTDFKEKIQEKFSLFTDCELVFCEDVYEANSRGKTVCWNSKDFEQTSTTCLINWEGSKREIDFQTQFPSNLMNSIICAGQFISDSRLISKIKNLEPLSSRLEIVEAKKGNLVLNDAYSFDLDSLKIALLYQLENGEGKVPVLICSALTNEINKEVFWELVAQYKIKELVFVGTVNTLPDSPNCKILSYPSKDDLVKSEYFDELRNSIILIKGFHVDHLEEITLSLEKVTHKTWLEIDLSAMRDNVQFFRDLTGHSTKLLVMVKASAYGSGLERIGRFLEKEKVDYLGVAYTEEGVQLREAGVKLPILVMNSEAASFEKLIKFGLEPSIYSLPFLEEYIRFLIRKGLKNQVIHLKLETGMHRLGFEEQELQSLLDKLINQPEVYVKSVFSHLSSSDDPFEIAWTKEQLANFDKAVGILENGLGYPFIRHMYNTNGILNLEKNPYEMARMGIGLYGISEPQSLYLEPVLKLKTKVSQIKWIKKGDAIGYSRQHIADKDMKIGVIAIGYADGLMRSYSEQGEVSVNGKRAKIVGNICMDMTMIDLSEIDSRVNDEVEIFGSQIPVSELADKMGTIPYEVFTRISDRVKRIYLD